MNPTLEGIFSLETEVVQSTAIESIIAEAVLQMTLNGKLKWRQLINNIFGAYYTGTIYGIFFIFLEFPRYHIKIKCDKGESEINLVGPLVELSSAIKRMAIPAKPFSVSQEDHIKVMEFTLNVLGITAAL